MPELFILPNPEAADYYKTTTLNGDNAGVDLYLPNKIAFEPGEKKLVSMGIRAVMADGNSYKHYWMVPRSSISKTGLMMLNSVGVIDKTYRGELMAFLWNTTNSTIVIEAGNRLVQIVAGDMSDITAIRIVDSLPGSKRGEGGFGSTGK